MPISHRFRMLLLPCLAMFAATATAQPISRVYRADLRPPQIVFQHGLEARGYLADVLAHALGGSCTEPDPAHASVWVSTTHHLGMAEDFAWNQLRALVGNVPDPVVWIYTIRPDQNYMSVPALVQQAIHEGDLSEGSVYTPDHARILRWLRARTSIVRDGEVITHFVSTPNILDATPMRIVGNTLVAGTPVRNAMYLPLNTTALPAVHDLPNFIPPASIHMNYFDDSDSSCSMSCDGTTTSPMRLAVTQAASNAWCVARREAGVTPILQQILLD